MSENKTEYLDLYDINRKKTGRSVPRAKCFGLKNEYFLSVHAWIVNSKGEFLIQKRSMNKRVKPGLWSVHGGCVAAGEESLEACVREVEEEIGIKLKPKDMELTVRSFVPDEFGSLVDVWLVKQDVSLKKIKLNEKEVSEVKWVSLKELQELACKGEFMLNVLPALNAICKK